MLLKQNTTDMAKVGVDKVNNFLINFILHKSLILLLTRKQEQTNEL